jgi:hypothetical protein
MAAPSEGAKVREKIYLTADEMLRLAGALEDKILPRLRSIEISGEGIGNNTTLIGVMDSLGENQLKSLISALQADPRPTSVPQRHRTRARRRCERCTLEATRLANDVAVDARERTAAAETLEAELLAHLEEVRAYHRSRAPIDPHQYDADVGGALWLLDVLHDWRDGRLEETRH